MIRLLSFLMLAACASGGKPVSSMNFLMEPMDPRCAVDAVEGMEGFTLTGLSIGERRTVARYEVGTVEGIKVIVSNPRRGASEASVVVRPGRDADPLEQRMARMAVEAADEAIYINCTEDGRTYGTASVVIEGQKE